jgi:GDP-4-dehydro-6-deoxy-D-mannose reductase
MTIATPFADQKAVLITGGTGFAGSHLIEALYQAGYRNIHTTSFSGITDAFVSHYATIHKVDLTDADVTNTLFKKLQPEYIYHLASYSVTSDAFAQVNKLLQNNTTLHVNVLEAMRSQTPHARLLSIGSAEEYGILPTELVSQKVTEKLALHPTNPYAVSKVSQELLSLAYAHTFGLHIVCARPFNHIGERQSNKFVVPSLAQQLIRVEQGLQDLLQIGNLTAVKDFSDVKDVVQAYMLLMAHGQRAAVYNIGSGTGMSIQNLLEQMIELVGVPVHVEVDQARWRPVLTQPVIPDISAIITLGWQPQHQLKETLLRILAYWRTQL